MNTSNAIVLLSGGIDSALNLALASKNKMARLALYFDYGQRARISEMKASQSLAEYYGVLWKRVELPWLTSLGTSALTQKEISLPQFTNAELDINEKTDASMKQVWVPNRNAVFLSIAASFAESFAADTILAGFNAEEASTFPDNSVPFMEAISKAFSFSTLNKVKVDSFTKSWDKEEIFRQALELELPLQFVWSCYEGGDFRCGKCESCKRSERGLKVHGQENIWNSTQHI